MLKKNWNKVINAFLVSKWIKNGLNMFLVSQIWIIFIFDPLYLKPNFLVPIIENRSHLIIWLTPLTWTMMWLIDWHLSSRLVREAGCYEILCFNDSFIPLLINVFSLIITFDWLFTFRHFFILPPSHKYSCLWLM